MGRHRYPAPHWENTSRRLYKSTYWEIRCSYINQPECFSSIQFLLIALTMILILRKKTKTQCIQFSTTMKQIKTSLPQIWSIWNSSIDNLKEIYSRDTSLKQKLLLLCGDVEANPGPYNEGYII